MALREDRSIPDSHPEPEDRPEPAPAGRPPAVPARPSGPAAPVPPTAPPPTKKPNARKRAVIATVLALAASFGGYEGYRYWTDGRFMVSTDDAYVTADITILTPKVAGYVTAVEVETNGQVRIGDVIVRIDDGDYRLAVRAAKDRLETLRATAGRIDSQIAAARAQVTQAEPQIDAARADATRTVADLERQTRLSQGDFVSRARFEQSQADRDRAAASVRTAEAALAVARANVDVLSAQRKEAERTAAEAETALARAERDLGFTVIRAPTGGVIGNRAAEVGTYVQPGTRLAALVPLDSVHIDANFKETQLGSIRPGQVAHVAVDAFPGRDIPAKVESLAPASGSQFSLLPPENATGNFTKIVQRVPVRVRVDPAVAGEGFLRPGMSVVVRIDSRDRPAAAGEAARR